MLSGEQMGELGCGEKEGVYEVQIACAFGKDVGRASQQALRSLTAVSAEKVFGDDVAMRRGRSCQARRRRVKRVRGSVCEIDCGGEREGELGLWLCGMAERDEAGQEAGIEGGTEDTPKGSSETGRRADSSCCRRGKDQGK
jgi:hypothetical protein